MTIYRLTVQSAFSELVDSDEFKHLMLDAYVGLRASKTLETVGMSATCLHNQAIFNITLDAPSPSIAESRAIGAIKRFMAPPGVGEWRLTVPQEPVKVEKS